MSNLLFVAALALVQAAPVDVNHYHYISYSKMVSNPDARKHNAVIITLTIRSLESSSWRIDILRWSKPSQHRQRTVDGAVNF